MSQTTITLAFEQWKAQQGMTGEAVLLDEFVFASVPGLNPDQPIDRSETLPPADQIVYRQSVTRKGVVNENAVVHSVVLGADVGDFSFNWIGLINKASGTLAMIVHAPVQQKLKTKEGQQGNVLTRSFLMEYNGAQTETGINTPAETWQIDFTARMAGMDERQRLENIDIYGAAAFFGDGWLVGKNGNQFYVTSGAGYVAGLRAQLGANQNITVTTMPVNVWLDVCWVGTLTSAWEVQSKVTVAESLADYEQNGVKHHVFALASIDANGVITDLRPKGSLGDQQASRDFLRKDANLSDIRDAVESRKHLGLKGAAVLDVGKAAGTVAAGDDTRIVNALQKGSNLSDVDNKEQARANLELKSAAIKDVTTSTLDTTPGRVTQVGDYGIGGDTIGLPGGANVHSWFVDKPTGKYKGGSNITGTAYPGAPWYEFDWMSHAKNLYGFLVEYTADGRAAIHVLSNGAWSGVYSILTSTGGSVDHLDNARFYSTRQGVWQGGGAFVNQLTDGTAPFYVPTLTAPNDTSVYLPICKGSSQIDGHGFVSAVSFGMLRSGGKDFGSALIHIIGDNGSMGYCSLDINGNFNTSGNLIAGQGVFESNGSVRVYSPNNMPPPDVPPGVPLPWPSSNPPDGYVVCVGQSFNTSTFPRLAAAYPAGYLPDMRGVFIRGWDNGRGVDPGRGINSLQYGQAPASGIQRGAWGSYAQLNRGINVMIGTDNDGYPNVTQESESQRETRPINVAFNYIVRAA
ncbi:phage tail-collar fiber domain-containing protein [Yokenella regensburgei]|uniref:phage tail-collar fiber domain-containing protein n=1 Tax=Yokenella regensburgei TaxID=158877 RepID=UPI0002423101|nr:phage tail protein [Yokenella regensburgei]EHM47035.1 phage tail collar domain protein [Yokenella regensburgei ATCC 43003]